MRPLFFSCLLFFLSSLSIQNIAKESLVQVDQAEIFCKTVGNGSPIIVLHGGPGLSHDYLFPTLSKLSSDHLVLFFDQRANGRSTGEIEKETLNLDTFIEDIESVRKAQGFDKITLLGHCWGGILAMKYALTYPEFVHKLILMDSLPPSTDDCFLVLRKMLQATAPYQKEILEIEKNLSLLETDPEILRRYVYLKERPSFYNADYINVEDFLSCVTQKSVENSLKIAEIFAASALKKPFNWYVELKESSIETLIIHGVHDFTPLFLAKKLQKTIPGSKILFFENSGHCPFIEETEDVLFSIKEFLNES